MRHMKRRYPPVLIVVLAMWILVTVSTTVVMAYMFRKTPTVNNQFDPASMACQVNETFENVFLLNHYYFFYGRDGHNR